ncbi:MAG: flippase-like domain-containing protein [Bacteroidales bacterium]|jgi:uncharacterized protein (TIRG00374 family)|nr:flippase-like domain-containing protein [Bacteroidales bacterium]MCI2121330.1 flippase-like domain-containing protein [Bacteroidales bacterium]MCI2145919.1 flippase-like domain-containing protein [Bacteroidales bacterium]
MTKKTKNIIGYAIALVLAVVMLYFAFRGIKWGDFVKGLRECNWWWIAAAMVTAVLAIVFRAFRWRLLLLPLNKDITKLECYDAYSIGYLVNLALPRAGEVGKCGIVAMTKKTSFESALGTMVVERSLDLVCAILGFILMVLFTRFGGFLIEKIWRPAVAGHTTALFIVLAIIAFFIISYILIRLNRKWLRIHSNLFRKFEKVWKGLVDGLKTCLTMNHKWAFLIYTLIIWACYWAMSWFIILAMPEMRGLNLMDALFLTIVGSIGWIVPVQGGFGAYHFIVSQTLAPIYGIPLDTGLVFATLNHESEVVVFIICGALSLINVYLIAPRLRRKKMESKS